MLLILHPSKKMIIRLKRYGNDIIIFIPAMFIMLFLLLVLCLCHTICNTKYEREYMCVFFQFQGKYEFAASILQIIVPINITSRNIVYEIPVIPSQTVSTQQQEDTSSDIRLTNYLP